MFFSMPLMGFINLSTQFFQAIGKAVPAFIIAIVRPVVFLVPLASIMSRTLGLDGIFLSFPGSDLLTSVLIIFLIIPIIRQLKKAVVSAKQDKENTPTSGQLVESTEAIVSN
jgi:Na+-driven multidrug efflux pump